MEMSTMDMTRQINLRRKIVKVKGGTTKKFVMNEERTRAPKHSARLNQIVEDQSSDSESSNDENNDDPNESHPVGPVSGNAHNSGNSEMNYEAQQNDFVAIQQIDSQAIGASDLASGWNETADLVSPSANNDNSMNELHPVDPIDSVNGNAHHSGNNKTSDNVQQNDFLAIQDVDSQSIGNGTLNLESGGLNGIANLSSDLFSSFANNDDPLHEFHPLDPIDSVSGHANDLSSIETNAEADVQQNERVAIQHDGFQIVPYYQSPGTSSGNG